MENELSLQDRYGPQTVCFGCGPANERGLQIKSYVQGQEVVCEWQPQKHHEASAGMLNGGIIATLTDCHSNWAAAYHLMNLRGGDKPPVTVTADFEVKLKRPTPTDGPVRLVARIVESSHDRALIETELHAGGKVTAVFRGTFVAVEEGHPAYHRW